MARQTVLAEVKAPPTGGRVVAIGVFDGVHIGHQRVLKEAVAEAARLNALPTAVTFYPHPDAVLRPGLGPQSLTSPGRKGELLCELGIEEVVTVQFDEEFSRLEPEAFCRLVLSDRLGARVVFVGENFRFGRGGAGTSEALAAYGENHGFGVRALALVDEEGGPVSSTRIRQLLTEGDVAEAATLLGRPHRLEGFVVRGKGRGRGLGAPTANLELLDGLALPMSGVYVSRTLVDDKWYESVCSVGCNPTFEGGGEICVETLLMGYDGDLYGLTLSVDFLERLRAQRSFADGEELAEQIDRDVRMARAVHKRSKGRPGGRQGR